MKISILTLFPDMFMGPFAHSIIKRAMEKNLVSIEYVNIRDFGIGKHQIVDDTPYGGGIGMVLRVDVVHKALEHCKKRTATEKQRTVLLSASGSQFRQHIAKEYAAVDHLILICGHYEGIDDRIRNYIDDEISIGDFITTGGEIPAMLITDAVTRLLPGVFKTGVTESESFSLSDDTHVSLLEFPQYTKPPVYNDLTVPGVLLSGNHKEIAAWRTQESLKKTEKIRPDLLKS